LNWLMKETTYTSPPGIIGYDECRVRYSYYSSILLVDGSEFAQKNVIRKCRNSKRKQFGVKSECNKNDFADENGDSERDRQR